MLQLNYIHIYKQISCGIYKLTWWRLSMTILRKKPEFLRFRFTNDNSSKISTRKIGKNVCSSQITCLPYNSSLIAITNKHRPPEFASPMCLTPHLLISCPLLRVYDQESSHWIYNNPAVLSNGQSKAIKSITLGRLMTRRQKVNINITFQVVHHIFLHLHYWLRIVC